MSATETIVLGGGCFWCTERVIAMNYLYSTMTYEKV